MGLEYYAVSPQKPIMLIPKAVRKEIYTKLFQDGVMVAKKDFNLPKHPECELASNNMVVRAMQSLKSRGFVHEQYAWRHFYWSLTNEGIDYLREYLNIPTEVLPKTLMRAAAPAAPAGGRPQAGRGDRDERRGGFGGDRGDRDSYRRGPVGGVGRGFGGPDKKVGAPAGFAPEFRGGFGRGRGSAQ